MSFDNFSQNPRQCKTVNLTTGASLVIATTDSITAVTVPPSTGSTFLGTVTGSDSIDISAGITLGFGDRPFAGTITAGTGTLPIVLWY